MSTTTHAFAAELEALAGQLREQEDTEIDSKPFLVIGGYDMTKECFRKLARIFAPLTKEYDKYDVRLIRDTKSLSLWLRINRDKVCRKIQEEKWECDPVFSPEEEAALETRS